MDGNQKPAVAPAAFLNVTASLQASSLGQLAVSALKDDDGIWHDK